MAGAFDPYRTWLGIPPGQRSPDHYRLLGLPLFEDRPEAIQRAADQRMADLHALQTGEHAQAARELLAEVAAARVCLLDSQKKAAYDRRLRQVLQIEPPGIPEPPPVREALEPDAHRSGRGEAVGPGLGPILVATAVRR